MRRESYAVAATAAMALHHASAWTSHSNPQWMSRALYTTTGASLMMEGEVDTPKIDAVVSGTLLAEGSIVSFFRGGLAAVRVGDETIQASTVETTGRVPERLKNTKTMTTDAGEYLV